MKKKLLPTLAAMLVFTTLNTSTTASPSSCYNKNKFFGINSNDLDQYPDIEQMIKDKGQEKYVIRDNKISDFMKKELGIEDRFTPKISNIENKIGKEQVDRIRKEYGLGDPPEPRVSMGQVILVELDCGRIE
ncbi:hypothetical protein SY83_02885 [Paenibacillus swuensis]|uniref:Uncharacterized protein n=1 Tax=Paenibacillus swuensis TaxID=1178515 RepID=A0A172TEQ9_9BACL|nr:hypothetical protein [Paenibacillus swuensis]ANE45442.1 hypothetical protein SY83_02885 [Paenibacillus swuensis]